MSTSYDTPERPSRDAFASLIGEALGGTADQCLPDRLAPVVLRLAERLLTDDRLTITLNAPTEEQQP